MTCRTILSSCLRYRITLPNFRRAFSSSTEEIPQEKLEETIPQELLQEKREVPLILKRELDFLPKYKAPKVAWLENLDSIQEQKLGLLDLHPDVFGEMPRIDIIHENVDWQRKYKFVSYAHSKTRAEVRGGGRKPWQQKGLGKARHGSIRSPLWRGGGIAHGPRSPTTYFYMLPFYKRILGLTSTLSVKLAQDDLHIVDSLEIPTDDPQYLEELVAIRNWGISVLFVDVVDLMPRNISVAANHIKYMNLMPAYGLNVYSMLKHETLVLTLAAVQHIEEKILFHLHRTDNRHKLGKFRINQV